ncbi:MAG: MBL fold metallo-hydrolase [Bradymonadaceae bacterium]|nr:MBL fold metallo-hydrolase [Lujinxingiaceae bacterium]
MIDQFWLFHCGYARVPRAAIVANAGYEIVSLPFMAAVAVHSEHGPILVDAPYGHDGPKNASVLMASMLRATGLKFREEWSVVPRLEQLGYQGTEIKHILMTHLHSDHTGAMKELTHATFHLFEQEWSFPFTLSPIKAMFNGYARADFSGLSEQVKLHESPQLGEDEALRGVDVFGDGSVEMIPLHGHSPGMAGYRFTLADGRRIFHVGDAAFFLSHITEGDELGFLPRNFAQSLAPTQKTLERLRRHHVAFPDDVLVTSHDCGLGGQCLERPVALHAI